MSYDFNNDIPIYLQIIEHIKLQIINKTYLPNQKIPSVRDLSVLYEVNPNTVQKALTELETMGLIFTESTNGKFVTNNQTIIDNIKKQTTTEMIDNFLESIKELGINKADIIDLLTKKENLWIY